MQVYQNESFKKLDEVTPMLEATKQKLEDKEGYLADALQEVATLQVRAGSAFEM